MGYAFRDILLLIPTHILKLFVVHFLLKYLETFRDIFAVLCGGGGEIKYLETFRDIGDVLCGGGGSGS